MHARPRPGSAVCGGLDTLSDTRAASSRSRPSITATRCGSRSRSAGYPGAAAERIAELKATVARALAPHATGLLIDVELGRARDRDGRPGAVRIVVPLEAQGYEDVAAGRVTTSFLPGFSPALARTLGAAACKLLLPYRPDHEASAARQDEVVRRRSPGVTPRACRLILEPIVYRAARRDAEQRSPTAFPCARGRGRRASARRSGRTSSRCSSRGDDRGDEAEWCRHIDAACGATPWVLLGGGGSPEVFARDLRIACAAGASGFIAGRTLWTGVIGDDDEAETWLRRVGVPLLRSLRDIAQSGRPWRERAGAAGRTAARLVRLDRRCQFDSAVVSALSPASDRAPQYRGRSRPER